VDLRHEAETVDQFPIAISVFHYSKNIVMVIGDSSKLKTLSRPWRSLRMASSELDRPSMETKGFFFK
jgi:hypothetical protein